jgi:hypothetical protein
MPPKRNFAVDNCERLMMTRDGHTFHSLLRVVPCVPSGASQRIQRAQVSKIKEEINCLPIDFYVVFLSTAIKFSRLYLPLSNLVVSLYTIKFNIR